MLLREENTNKQTNKTGLLGIESKYCGGNRDCRSSLGRWSGKASTFELRLEGWGWASLAKVWEKWVPSRGSRNTRFLSWEMLWYTEKGRAPVGQ